MLRVAIAEDSHSDREKLKEFFHQFSKESKEECQLTEFFDGMALLEQYQPVYDLVLLDIEMPHIDGMKAARELRDMDSSVLIMFITNMAQYALKGYEVDALDYVLKPISYYAFAMKMKKVQRILRERNEVSKLLPFEGTLRRMPINSILYIEVTDHKLCYHTYEGDSVVTGSMKALEQELTPLHFVRCNNCYLVNLVHVRSVTQDTVWIENNELKISRPRRKAFMQALAEYYGGGGR